MILKTISAPLACGVALAVNAQAQIGAMDSKAVEPLETEAAVGRADDRIPAKTIVEVEITDAISSKTNSIGDMFALKLAAPLIIDGRTILPAGLVGRGEVTHAARSGWGGRAGELIVNARYLECGDFRVPLGHFRYGSAGKNNNVNAFLAGQAMPLVLFVISGHDAVIPAGVRGTAQVKADVTIPAGAIEECGSIAG